MTDDKLSPRRLVDAAIRRWLLEFSKAEQSYTFEGDPKLIGRDYGGPLSVPDDVIEARDTLCKVERPLIDLTETERAILYWRHWQDHSSVGEGAPIRERAGRQEGEDVYVNRRATDAEIAQRLGKSRRQVERMVAGAREKISAAIVQLASGIDAGATDNDPRPRTRGAGPKPKGRPEKPSEEPLTPEQRALVEGCKIRVDAEAVRILGSQSYLLEDAKSAGYLALTKAVRRYKGTGGAGFFTYARHDVVSEIRRTPFRQGGAHVLPDKVATMRERLEGEIEKMRARDECQEEVDRLRVRLEGLRSETTKYSDDS